MNTINGLSTWHTQKCCGGKEYCWPTVVPDLCISLPKWTQGYEMLSLSGNRCRDAYDKTCRFWQLRKAISAEPLPLKTIVWVWAQDLFFFFLLYAAKLMPAVLTRFVALYTHWLCTNEKPLSVIFHVEQNWINSKVLFSNVTYNTYGSPERDNHQDSIVQSHSKHWG